MLKRNILAKIWEKIDSPEILLLNGPRQVGKTTLMQLIKEKLVTDRGIKPNNILWFDLEKSEDLLVWFKQITALAALPTKDKQNKYYLFIDEFQKSETIGSTLKVLHDHHPNFKAIITGSASWYLNLDESMAGRKRVFPIWPFGFGEFLDQAPFERVKSIYQIINQQPSAATADSLALVNNAFLEFLTYGGYPAVITAVKKQEKEAILSEIINSYILRDIKIYNYSANTLQVKKILTLLADQIAGLLDINRLASDSGLGRVALINRLDLLENTFILKLITPYFTNKTKELVKNPKIFLVDFGLRNSLLDNFSIQPQTQNFGQLAENFAIMELLKNETAETNKINYWRTKTGQEVDLVLKRGQNLAPVEIKSGQENNIPDNLKKFIKKYQPREALVLNWNTVKELKFEKTLVKFRPLWFII